MQTNNSPTREVQHRRIITTVFKWNTPISIKRLRGGLTNFNYLVQDADKKRFVARFAPLSNKLLGLSRTREVHNLRLIRGLDLGPELIAIRPRERLLIVAYIPGVVFSTNIIRSPTILRAVAGALKNLHSSKKKFAGIFDRSRS